MRTQSEKTNVRTYLDYGYNYVVVMTETEYCNQPMYQCDFFKTRKKAEKFNREQLQGWGNVMTTRQAVNKYEFLTM